MLEIYRCWAPRVWATLCDSNTKGSESKVLTCREKIKREREGGRERQPVHGEIMMQDQRAKVVVTWAMVGRVKSGFIDTLLVDKKKGDNYVVISFWLVTSLVVPYVNKL